MRDVKEFQGFSQAALLYCDGQLHASTTDAWGLHFAGHHIVEAALKELLASHGLDEASVLVLTGWSAGGAAAYYNALFVKRFLEPYGVKVVAVPEGPVNYQAAYFDLLFPAIAAQPWGPDFLETWFVSSTAEITGQVRNEACLAAHDNNITVCSDSAVYMPYLLAEVPTFVVWNRWDSHPNLIGATFMFDDARERSTVLSTWGNMHEDLFRNFVQADSGSDLGVFHPSCFDHAVTPRSATINGQSKGDAIGAWFRTILSKWGMAGGRNEDAEKYQLLGDEFGSNMGCNPTCCSEECRLYATGCGEPVGGNCPSKQVLSALMLSLGRNCRLTGDLCGKQECMCAYLTSPLVNDDCSLAEMLNILGLREAQRANAEELLARLRSCDIQDFDVPQMC
jgi:hypothetical protein